MVLSLEPLRSVSASPNYRWWAYAAVAVGMFLTVMDQSGVNIALPVIAEHFAADIPTAQWITLGYVLSTSAMLLPMGRLSDMVGRKAVYAGGFVVFIAAAAVGASAQSMPLLVGAKIVQGAGSAAIQANGLAMITQIFPERERGKAVGLYMTTIGTGAISGPIIGGALVSALGWRSVFLASVPVGLVALAAAMLVLQPARPSRLAGAAKTRFDWWGAALSSAALLSLLLGLTFGQRVGWDSSAVVVSLAAAVVIASAFILWELRATDPLLDLRLFRSKVFSIGMSARFLSFVGGSAVFFLMPFFLVQGKGYPASVAGLLMVPGSIGIALMGPVAGRLSDKIGSRLPTITGMGLTATAMLLFSRLTVDSPPVHVILGMVIHGAGMGTFSSTNTSAILGSLHREQYGIATAFINVIRTTANVTGIALATTIVTITMASMDFEPNLSVVTRGEGSLGVRVAFVAGLSRSFLASAAAMLTAMVLSSLIRGNRTGRAPDGDDAGRSS